MSCVIMVHFLVVFFFVFLFFVCFGLAAKPINLILSLFLLSKSVDIHCHLLATVEGTENGRTTKTYNF